MMQSPEHISNEVLQHYADGHLPGAKERDVAAHIVDCVICRTALADYTRIGNSLKHLALVKASPSFTGTVLQRLNIVPRRDRVYALLMHTGTAFAFLLVAAILAAVFSWMGVSDQGTGEGDGGAMSWLGTAGDAIARTAGGTGTLTAKIVSYFTLQGGTAILLFGVAVVGLLAAADYLLQKRSIRH